MQRNVWLLILPLWPMVCAPVSLLIENRRKNAGIRLAAAVCAAELAASVLLLCFGLRGGALSLRIGDLCGLGVSLCLDGFRGIYCTVAGLMWTMTTLFSEEYFSHEHRCGRYLFSLLITFGATVGVFLSADLYTTFLFFEIVSLISGVMVVQEETPDAMRAGDTYLCVAVLGGMVMLMGIFLLSDTVGTLAYAALPAACAACADRGRLYLSAFLLLFGFGAKAGVFPLHIWLPKAHPVAPAPASALLSGILTKTGIFGILIITAYLLPHDRIWGSWMLALAMVTMVLGAVLAVFSVDIKRTLACSSVSQIGFILTGAAMQSLLGSHNALAVRGTVLHMINHSLLKLVLFMAAGVVYMNLHTLDFNRIKGCGRGKPALHAAFLMGYLGICGVMLWNGYISKTLLHESIVEAIELLHAAGEGTLLLRGCEWIFLFSGGLTVAYMTKLYLCLFWDHRPHEAENRAPQTGRYLSRTSAFALLGSAAILPILGMLPTLTMDRLASASQGFLFGGEPAHAVHYFAWSNLRGALISLCIGAAVYLLVIRRLLMQKTPDGETVYLNRWPAPLDLEDLVYRPLMLKALPAVGFAAAQFCDRLPDLCGAQLMPAADRIARTLDVILDTIIYLRGRLVITNGGQLPLYREFSFMRERRPIEAIARRIRNSFSFGLLLFSGGLCIVLLYTLFGRW